MTEETDGRAAGVATDGVVAKLQALVRIPTVSHRDPRRVDKAAFDRILEELERLFPLVHERLEVSRVGGHGLLVRWPGRSAERPVVLMAHLDVVPVDDPDRWQHPPFGGEVHDGAVWGRGTLDDKGALVAACEAVETLLAAGHVPAQDVWLSLGCDEEVAGRSARLAVEELRSRGVRPWLVVDEGGAVASEAFPGVRVPVAVVGVSEKGATSVELVVEGRGGHASTPARHGPTARLARAITRIDRHPMAARVPDPTIELFRRLAPHAPVPLRTLMAGAHRMRGLLGRALVAAGAESAAMARTTFAITTLSGSPARNVIAARARAGVNVRLMVGDSVASVLEHLRRVIDDDEVRVEVVERGEPSPVSAYDGEAFALVEGTIRDVFPDALPSPYVTMAATDSRLFTPISDHVFRFTPFRMSKDQRASLHSHDEHLGTDDLADGVRWFRCLIERIPG